MSTSTTTKPFWTVKELADYYGLAQRTFYDLMDRGELRFHKFGGRRGIRVSDEDRLDWEQRCRKGHDTADATVGVRPWTEPTKPTPFVARQFGK
ncbi:MAG: helix-turn-helix domain-containing protein [Planctomycetota bacterium]